MSQQPTRREFAQKIVALAAAPAAALASRLPASADSTDKKPPDPAAEAAKALAELAHARYGKFLTEDQFKAVKRHLAYRVASGRRLGQFKLKNSDEPTFLFRADLP
jgi:hypothetical protein